MIKIIKCIKAVPVTMADRAAYEDERDQHEKTIGHLKVRWDKLAGALNSCSKIALEARSQAGSQIRSAQHDADDLKRFDPQVFARLDSAQGRRLRSDARLGKLHRWRTDIGGSVRGRISLFAKRVNEISKIIVSGVQELPVEIRIDTEAGTAEMTRLDTGHVVAMHELTAQQKRKYAPPPAQPTAEERTGSLPFPKTDAELAEEAKPREPEVIDEMPKAEEASDGDADFQEFIHRGRSVEDRLVKEFGATEARRIVEAIKAGQPGDVVIEEARARKAAAKKGAEHPAPPPPPAAPPPPEPEPMIGISDKDMLLWEDEFGEEIAAEIANQVAGGIAKDLAVHQARKREKQAGTSKEAERVSANDREHAAIVKRHTAELGAGLAERLAWVVRSGGLEEIALEHARASLEYADANPDLVAELGEWWGHVEKTLMTGFDFAQAVRLARQAKADAIKAATPPTKRKQAKIDALTKKAEADMASARGKAAAAAFDAAVPPKRAAKKSTKKGGGK